MYISEATADAYTAAIRTDWVKKPRKVEFVPVTPSEYSVFASEGPGNYTDKRVKYRPSVFLIDPIWDKLHKNDQDWLAAILSDRRHPDRFLKHAINAIVGYTSASITEATELAYRIRQLTTYFTKEERAAIWFYWSEALKPDRKLPTRPNARRAGKFSRDG